MSISTTIRYTTSQLGTRTHRIAMTREVMRVPAPPTNDQVNAAIGADPAASRDALDVSARAAVEAAQAAADAAQRAADQAQDAADAARQAAADALLALGAHAGDRANPHAVMATQIGALDRETYDPAGVGEQVVGVSAAQTLRNKTLSPAPGQHTNGRVLSIEHPAANTTWYVALGYSGSDMGYDGYLKIYSSKAAHENEWVAAFASFEAAADQSGLSLRGFISAPIFAAPIQGRGDAGILAWTGSGGNFSGTARFGHDYPNGVSNAEVAIGPSTGFWRVRNNFGLEYLRYDIERGDLVIHAAGVTAASGVVLRDSAGAQWRITVSTAGAISAAKL